MKDLSQNLSKSSEIIYSYINYQPKPFFNIKSRVNSSSNCNSSVHQLTSSSYSIRNSNQPSKSSTKSINGNSQQKSWSTPSTQVPTETPPLTITNCQPSSYPSQPSNPLKIPNTSSSPVTHNYNFSHAVTINQYYSHPNQLENIRPIASQRNKRNKNSSIRSSKTVEENEIRLDDTELEESVIAFEVIEESKKTNRSKGTKFTFGNVKHEERKDKRREKKGKRKDYEGEIVKLEIDEDDSDEYWVNFYDRHMSNVVSALLKWTKHEELKEKIKKFEDFHKKILKDLMMNSDICGMKKRKMKEHHNRWLRELLRMKVLMKVD